MDLVLLSSELDAVAIKSGACLNCVEKKLNTKILKVFPKEFTPSSFKFYEAEYSLKGYNITCSCNNYVSLH